MAAHVQSLSPKYYLYEESYVRIDQIAGCNTSLHDFRKTHFCTLVNFIRTYKLDYKRTTMAVYLSFVFSPYHPIFKSATHNVEEKRSVRHGYCRVMLDRSTQ